MKMDKHAGSRRGSAARSPRRRSRAPAGPREHDSEQGRHARPPLRQHFRQPPTGGRQLHEAHEEQPQEPERTHAPERRVRRRCGQRELLVVTSPQMSQLADSMLLDRQHELSELEPVELRFEVPPVGDRVVAAGAPPSRRTTERAWPARARGSSRPLRRRHAADANCAVPLPAAQPPKRRARDRETAGVVSTPTRRERDHRAHSPPSRASSAGTQTADAPRARRAPSRRRAAPRSTPRGAGAPPHA